MLCYLFFRRLSTKIWISAMKLQELIPNISQMISYEYDAIRCAEYDAIISRYLNAAAEEAQPRLFHLCGLPGAGKTTFYRSHDWPAHVFIGFDDIMESIPQYQKDVRTLGSVAAFQKWEIPARTVGYELLRRAVSARKTIFFDNGALSEAHLHLLKNIKQYGYKTYMYYIRCDISTACRRAQIRQQETLRHIPVETIEKRAEIEQKVVPQYQKIADEFYTYNNGEKGFQLIESLSVSQSKAV